MAPWPLIAQFLGNFDPNFPIQRLLPFCGAWVMLLFDELEDRLIELIFPGFEEIAAYLAIGFMVASWPLLLVVPLFDRSNRYLKGILIVQLLYAIAQAVCGLIYLRQIDL